MILPLIYAPYLIVSIITLFCGNIFLRTGLAANLAWQPILNVYYWFKITRVRPVFVILLFVPYINLLFVLIMAGVIYKSLKTKKNALAVAWPFLWVDVVLFIVLQRTIINTFIIVAFTIPTSSMEKTYMTGTTLIAEKISYGPRMPVTPLSLPFFHSRIRYTNISSYLTWLQLPYYRFAGMGTIARNDVIVFNYPAQSQYPVDKREYYMKRCVALPGDTLQITDGTLFINGQKAWLPPLSQKNYFVRTDGTAIDFRTLESLGITDGGKYTNMPGLYLLELTATAKDRLKALPNVKSIEPYTWPKEMLETQSFYFPPDTNNYKWNPEQYGPLVIPKRGVKVQLNVITLPLYQRIISVYEYNKLEVKSDGSIFINGEKTNSYTFKMNYYFVMGDSRDNSEDSRFWGFVPEDHIDSKVWKSFNLGRSHKAFGF